MDLKYVLDNINKEIKKQKLTQKAVLAELNLSPTTFVDWRRGKSNSYIKYLPAFSDILNVPILSLINEDDYAVVEHKFWKTKKEKVEIVYCKDCGFYIHGLCVRKKLYTPFPPTGFCNYAVARSDSECEQCSKCIKNDVCVFKVDNSGECLYFAGNQ